MTRQSCIPILGRRVVRRPFETTVCIEDRDLITDVCFRVCVIHYFVAKLGKGHVCGANQAAILVLDIGKGRLRLLRHCRRRRRLLQQP